MSEFSWSKLEASTLKQNLIIASLYLTAYELLKDSIISQIEGFFTAPYGGKDYHTLLAHQYKQDVLSLDKSKLFASCLWLKNMGAITDGDIENVKLIRDHRNQIAHELPQLLTSSDIEVNIQYFVTLKNLLGKIDTWWIKEVELSISPDLWNVDREAVTVHSGPMIILDHIISIALKDVGREPTTNGG